jgi:uncharacterized protein
MISLLRRLSIVGIAALSVPAPFSTAAEPAPVTLANPLVVPAATFPVVRVAEAKRKFRSPAVEAVISSVSKDIRDPELAWLFANCFPNTIDTTINHFSVVDGKPDTYVITGDIWAMWLRDSTAQVWPYLPLMKDDPRLRQLIEGVIRRQVYFVLLDPYANAFVIDKNEVSKWQAYDLTEMKPGLHERKWEIDSLCYPIRLAHGYWKHTGDTRPFDADWEKAIVATVRTFREQQRKDGPGPYTFIRKPGKVGPEWTFPPGSEYGPPVTPVGLIASRFRPSDDEVRYQFLIPSNYFAVSSLRHAAEMLRSIRDNQTLAADCEALARKWRRPSPPTPSPTTNRPGASSPSRPTEAATTISPMTPTSPACSRCPTSTRSPSTTRSTSAPAPSC